MSTAAREAINRLNGRLRRCDKVNALLNEVSGLVEHIDPIYDPVKDMFAVRIPGDLARRLRELANDGESAT